MPDEHTERAVELMTGFAARRVHRAALPLDRRVRRLQLPRPRARDRRRDATASSRCGSSIRCITCSAGIAPTTRARGWISGLAEREGEAHPTRGGLRIGKPLPERAPGEPFDERLEWDRDGQYFHYLTKWMHALDQVARATGQPMFNVWARELAHAAHRAFTYAATPAAASGCTGS